MQVNYIEDISNYSSKAKVIFCDLWGVIHNGQELNDGGKLFLSNMKKNRVKVIFISNAPRPNYVVEAGLLKKFKLENNLFHSIITSGDISIKFINQKKYGDQYYHLGPSKDHDLLKDIDVSQVHSLAKSDFVLCTGLDNDDLQTSFDYKDILEEMLSRKLIMICANPDLIVMRGEKEIHCAGNVADYYQNIGGKVIFYGKPYNDIYEHAYNYSLKNKLISNKSEILAIGDSFRTDIMGAEKFGIDSVFVTSGIHINEIKSSLDLDALVAKYINSSINKINVIKNL